MLLGVICFPTMDASTQLSRKTMAKRFNKFYMDLHSNDGGARAMLSLEEVRDLSRRDVLRIRPDFLYFIMSTHAPPMLARIQEAFAFTRADITAQDYKPLSGIFSHYYSDVHEVQRALPVLQWAITTFSLTSHDLQRIRPTILGYKTTLLGYAIRKSCRLEMLRLVLQKCDYTAEDLLIPAGMSCDGGYAALDWGRCEGTVYGMVPICDVRTGTRSYKYIKKTNLEGVQLAITHLRVSKAQVEEYLRILGASLSMSAECEAYLRAYEGPLAASDS